MRLRTWQVATLLLATLTMGLTAGVFGDWGHTIMPGLGATDDRTFVGAFQGIDRAIINPMFLLTFLGGLVLSGAGALLHLGDDEGTVGVWSGAAFVLYLAVVAITMRVHVPLNDGIKGAGHPDEIDLSPLRTGFEARWVRWNRIRAVLCVAAFRCTCWALVELGQTT